MPRIHKLPLEEIQKIAAGEVVERPANVLKELLENALDAGARSITITVENGGKDLISIADDGCGMSPEDARMSIEHHATSKLTSVLDLPGITTFGFRGEALSSICAVSQTTLLTKDATALEGIELHIAGGSITQATIAACTTGTTIAVRNLFYNVPARRKFLKTKETEWHQIQQLIQAYSLLYTTISFKVIHDGKVVLRCPATDTLVSRITQLWDHNFAQAMLPFSTHDERNGIAISGATTHHQYARYDRAALFFFVNQRWVKNYTLAKALLKGYANVLPQGRYPAAAMMLTINPAHVDVNIHPRKEEVQFLHPRVIEQFIQDTIKKTLEDNLATQLKKPIAFNKAPIEHVIPRSTATKIDFALSTFAPAVHPASYQQPLADHSITAFTLPPLISTPRAEEQHAITSSAQEYTIIGQFNTTYILLEQPNGLFIIDQHAAHERILYELFAYRFKEVATVALLFPTLITLCVQEITTLAPYLPVFIDNGITVDIFSPTQLIVQALPVHLKDQNVETIIRQTVVDINEYQILQQQEALQHIHEKLRAQMACKAAVKAGDSLTLQQMQKLIDDLYTCDNRLTCPHGRPTGWLLSLYDIEKRFKRKL